MTPRRRDWLLLLFFFPVIVMVTVGVRKIEEQEKRAIGSSLQTVLKTTHNGLRLWADEMRVRASVPASNPLLRRDVLELLALPRQPEPLRSSKALERLRGFFAPTLAQHGYRAFAVVTPDGVTIAGESSDDVGGTAIARLDPVTLAAALEGRAALGLPFRARIAAAGVGWTGAEALICVGAPIRDASGVVVAALLFAIDPARDFTRMAQLGRTGQTGETYAFDRQGRLITESRFDAHLRAIGAIRPDARGLLSIEVRDPGGNMVEGYRPSQPRSAQPFTLAVEESVRGRQGLNVQGYRDYRGVPVVGAWLWDEDLKMGLATEIDVDEAFAPLRTIRNIILLMLGVTVTGAAAVSIILRQRARALADSVSREQAARAAAESHVRELKAAKAELQEAVRTREEFLTVASHELRTPTTTLQLQTQNLVRQLHKPHAQVSVARIDKSLGVMERQVAQLVSLIDRLFDLSRIAKSFTLDRREIDLSAFTRELVERFRELFAAAGCTLELHADAQVRGFWDPMRLEQVIVNLLTNATKYGRGRPVVVDVYAEDSKAILSVADRGIGIAKEDQAKLFDRFVRLVSPEHFGGLGLGLYISRVIVEAHGGTIGVSSELGHGSSFVVKLPVKPPAEALGS